MTFYNINIIYNIINSITHIVKSKSNNINNIYFIVYLQFNNTNMLTLDLTNIFNAKGIDKPFPFLTKAGFSYHTTHNLLNSKSRIFRLDHIEKLCEVLICEPNDLLSWTPDKNKIIADQHPLHKLKNDKTAKNLKETLANLSYKEIEELTKRLTKDETDKHKD